MSFYHADKGGPGFGFRFGKGLGLGWQARFWA